MRLAAISFATAAAALVACAEPPPELSDDAAYITVVPNGSTCASLGFGLEGFTIPNPTNGTYQVDAANSLLFRYYDDTNTIFFFTQSSLRMNAVMIASGGQTAVWDLDGGATGWPSLHGAIDPTTGTLATPDSVTFCYDYELYLNPNAYAHHGVSHTWSITKTGLSEPLLLAEGQHYFAQYTVTVSPSTSDEAGLIVAGPVFVNNPNPRTPVISDLTVMIGDLPATVTCPVAFPYTMPAFTTLTCEFRVEVPDTTDRLVYVDVVSDGTVQVDRSLETASFADHTTSTEHYDECVKVMDAAVPYGFLGTACIAEGTKTFTYQVLVGPYDTCGDYQVDNLAWYEGLDTGATGSATWTVDIEVPCPQDGGCTLTPGYWKTHSSFGPAPYDPTWAQLPQGASTTFFLSGGTYYQALWTAPGGNSYWTLARAYIAAQLNGLNGASQTAVATTFAQATTFLQTYTPAQVAATKALKNQVVRMAGILDDYNNGFTGPGHCDE